MLKTWIPGEAPEKEELKQQLDAARKKLYDLQMKIKEHKLPVLCFLRDGVPPARAV